MDKKKADKKKYPIRAEDYDLYEEVGNGGTASVYRAHCKPLNEIVAIKILDFERDRSDLNNIMREVQTMMLLDHPNLLNAHCTFVKDHMLWVVMPYMEAGSGLHILKTAYPDGLEESIIATILLATLNALDYLHRNGHIHRDVKAGNILLDKTSGIKLGDFGVSACLFESGDRQRLRNTITGTPCWMAPEVMKMEDGYDCKADIWSFGITALELAHGHAPFSKYPPMKVFLMTLQNAPPGLDHERDKTRFTKSFRNMIGMCLVKEPKFRPTARKLLKHSFFKQARSQSYINRKLLSNLPVLGEQYKALKEKEEALMAKKQMPDGEKEELSQSEYKRGISTWNFDLDDLKAQAALVPEENCECSMHDIDSFQDNTENESSQNNGNKKCCDSNGCSETENLEKGESVVEQDRKTFSRELSFGASFLSNVQGEKGDEKKSKKENGDENAEKTKPPVVRGRFKVTSSLDFDKATVNLSMQKSYSMQALSHVRASSVVSSVTSGTQNSHPNSIYSHLLNLLNANLQERDAIRGLMWQISVGERPPFLSNNFASAAPSPRPVVITDTYLMEGAYRKESELQQEYNDIHWKLECVEDEIDKMNKELLKNKKKDDNKT